MVFLWYADFMVSFKWLVQKESIHIFSHYTMWRKIYIFLKTLIGIQNQE